MKSIRIVAASILLIGIFVSSSVAVSSLELRDGRPLVVPQNLAPELLPEATWTAEVMKGQTVLVASQSGQTALYLFLTHDFVNTVAYSGKPLEIMVALAPDGLIVKTWLVAHHEPILLVGIDEQVLHDFVHQYQGKNIADLLMGSSSGKSAISLDAVSGATVTALIADQVILTTAKLISQEIGVLAREAGSQTRVNDVFEPLGWDELSQRGLLQHVVLSAAEVEGDAAADQQDWLDLYFGVLSQPSLGMNLLGEEAFNDLSDDYPGRTLLVLLNNGSFSFRGSGFVRGGIFDRLELTQGMSIIRFRDSDYHYQFSVELADAPKIHEKAIFIVPDSTFNAALPWELEVLVTMRSNETSNSKKFIHFKNLFELPAEYIDSNKVHVRSAAVEMIRRIWIAKSLWIAVYLLLWISVILIFTLRRRVSRNRVFLNNLHLFVLLFAIVMIGVAQKGQPSVVNIFTFIDVVRTGHGSSLFLTEPFLFISWIMITITAILWGRGPFCGWICPYGALMEWTYKIRNWIAPRFRERELPEKWHDRLKFLPYVVFGVLLSVSLFSLSLAERFAEIEPFKTTWLVGVFNRPWYLALYWFVLLGAGFVIIRFFCRYLCPLGAYVAILSRFQIFKLPRRDFCTKCKICARGCSTRAIDDQGRIDSTTCFGCLDCLNTLNDSAVCPPLVREARGLGPKRAQG